MVVDGSLGKALALAGTPALAEMDDKPVTIRTRSMLARRELAHEILARRLAGEETEDIAEDLALPPGQVRSIIDEALEARAEPIEGVRTIELGRLETLAAKFYEKASAGDTRALAAYVKVHDRIAKIAGLHQPTRVQVSHSVDSMIDAAVSYEISPDDIQAALAEYHRQSTDPLGSLGSGEPAITTASPEDEIEEAVIIEDRGNLWTKQ